MHLRVERRGLFGFVILFVLMASFLFTPFIGLIGVARGSDPWWNSNWPNRKPITIDHTKIGGTVESFPVLIDTTDSNLASKAQQNGNDIAFVDSSTNTKLDHEIEYFDHNTGHLVAWVKINSLNQTTDYKMYVYYGNTGASNQQNPAGVWDSSFSMVQHLEENSGTRYDSTSKGSNLLIYGGVTKNSAGEIDGADSFNGVNGNLRQTTLSLYGKNEIMIDSWVNINSAPAVARLSKTHMYGRSLPSPLYWYGLWAGVPNVSPINRLILYVRLYNPSSSSLQTFTYNVNLVDQWVHVAWGLSKSAGRTYFYVNDALVKSDDISSLLAAGYTTPLDDSAVKGFSIGSNINGQECMKMSSDETRISETIRSSSWIVTSYNNQRSPSTFYTIGAEESTGANVPPSISNETPANGATNTYTNPTLSVKATDTDGDLMTIIFQTNATGIWQDIGSYTGKDGTYTTIPTTMNELGTQYYWMACAGDGNSWTNNTYHFATTTTVLTPKWTSTVPKSTGSVLIADINGDGLEEVIQAGEGGVVALNPINGNTIWSTSVTGAGDDMDTQMADLNKDGRLEIIVPLRNPGGVHVLFSNGSTFWRRMGIGGEAWSSSVIADIDGNGYPTIFIGTMSELDLGYNGTGGITKLSWNGTILQHVWVWHICAGGLSIDDADHDGEFELYAGDRSIDYGDGGYGRGVQSFWARNLTQRWSDPPVLSSSHIPMLADVNGDGIDEAIAGNHRGGIEVYDSVTGAPIRKTGPGNPDAPIHYQPTVYDIDGDGHLEILMADGSHGKPDNVIWDLVDWKVDWRTDAGLCYYGPREADLTGDGIMDVIASNFNGISVFENHLNNSYTLVANVTGLAGWLTYPVVQDMDGDGYLELVIGSTYRRAYAFDTPARAPAKRIRSEVQFYSERRLGAAEYVPPPGRQAPAISDLSPTDQAKNVPILLSQLSFTLTDYQKDKMDYTVTTTPFIGSDSGTQVANGIYSVPISGLEYAKTYTWKVNVTDGMQWTNETYTFTTESTPPWWNTTWQFRRQITVDHNQVSQDQTDFPLLIDLTDAALVGKVQADGDDFAFTDNTETKLDHQIELYDFNAGHLIAWVRIPMLSASTNTALYMYYGNPTAENQQNVTAVWDTSHRLVLHLNENYGPHECRLWGIIANTIPETVTMDQLVNLPYSLKNLGGGVQANNDGWGLAYYTTAQPTVLRGELSAYTDPNFNIAAQQLASSGASIAVGHVRNAASGATDIPDPHPFIRYKDGKWWAFGHNGVLSKSILKNLIGSEYLAQNPPTVGANWDDPAVVDTDLYMLYVLKNIEQDGWNVTMGIADAVTAISKLDSGAMNFFLTDGQTLWGFCRGKTLYYYYDGTYSALASQPPTAAQGSWIALSDFNLVKLTKTAPPQVLQDIRAYDPVPQCFDSTVNGNNGNLNNGVTQAVTGQIDGAYQFDGVNDYIEIPHSNTLSGFTTGFTASFWLRLDDTARRQTLLNKYNSGVNQRSWYFEFQTHATYGKVLSFFASQDGTNYREWHTRLTPTAGIWYYVTITWEPSTIPKFYVNGVQTPTLGTNTIASIYNNLGIPLLIGRCPYNTARYLRGGLDEIRISNPARSASYILTCYNNQKNPATFYSLSSEEALPSAPNVSEPDPENGATNIPITQNTLSFNLTDYQETMTYYVTTTPDIGQDTQPNVPNGRYAVTISNLQYATTYTWHVNVTDGAHWTNATFTFTTQAEPRLLVDPQFDDSADSVALRANGAGQDWYESRGAFSGGDPTLLTLDTANIGGDTGKKAALKNYGISSNAYLTQGFNPAQTGTFTVSFDIFIDRIQDNAEYDRAGHIFIGDDSATTNAPTGSSNERFVCLAFYDSTPGDSGTDLELRARTLSTQAYATTSQWTQVASGLSYDQWHTIKITVNMATNNYDVYVDGFLKGTFNKYNGYVSSSVTYMSFTSDSDGRGDYYVDNVFAPAMDRYLLTVTTVGSGTVAQTPGEASYASGATVTLTATPAEGCEFQGWSGDLSGNVSPTTIIMNGNKAATATFTQGVSYDDVVFDSSFDMGNLRNVQFQSGDASGNRFYTGEQNHTTVSFSDKHWWFYFSMDNVAGKTVTISLVNNEAIDFSGSRWPEIEPVFSYDNVNWERVPLSGVTNNSAARSFTMTVSVPLGQSKIWLAPLPPYNIAKRDALFAEFASSPYLTVTSLGTTLGGQELKVATITDPAYSDAGKFKSYVIAQQHAGEVQGSWNAEGLIRFLLSDDPTAIAIRRSYIFKIVPIVNVDGVLQGISRYTPLRSGVQYDLNRDWTARSQTEIQLIWNDLLSFQPDSFNDMHSTINTEVGSPKELLTYTWSTSDPEVLAFRASIRNGGFPETVTGTSSYACTVVHNGLGIDESVSWENPFDELSTNPGVKLTVNDWMTWGAAWVKGNYLYFGDAQGTLTTNVVGSGSITKNPDQATYSYGTSVQLTADPATGWYFAGWSGDASGSVSPTTVIMTGNKTVTATFTENPVIKYVLTVITVGNGNVQLDKAGPYDPNTVVQLTAVADSGWKFSGWSGSLSGNTNPTTIIMDGDKSVTATFTSTLQLYLPFTTDASDFSSYNNDGVTNGGVTHTADYGGAYIFDGTTGYIAVADNPDGSLDGNGAWDKLTIELWVRPDSATPNATRILRKGGSTAPYSYQIGFQTSNGHLYFDVWNPTNMYEVEYTTLLTANTWYHVVCAYQSGVGSKIYVNGIDVNAVKMAGSETGYISASRARNLYIGCRYGTQNWFDGYIDEVQIYSEALSSSVAQQHYDATKAVHAGFTITASAGAGGSIVPSGSVVVADGADQLFTIAADTGYEIADVLVDGGSVGAVSEYNFPAVSQDHTIEASFSLVPVTWTITASAGSGGSIDPVGAVVVADGADQLFTITPDTGYKVADVLVDGSSVGPVLEYTFSDVNADHTITAAFIQNQAPVIDSHTPTIDYPCINQGSQQAFTISASDPDGDPLTMQWYLDGTLTSTTESYTFDAVSGTSGVYNVTVEVADGFGGKATRIWFLTVDATLVMPFDTNVSPATDYAGGDNTGTVNGATWTSDGKISGSYSFDGTNDDITIADASNLDGDGLWTEITIEHWIYLAADQTGRRTISKYSATAEAKRSYQIGFQTATPANRLYGAVIIGSNSYQEAAYNTPLTAGVWYHVVLTYKSGDTVRLYLNGVQVAALGTLTGNIQASPDKPLYIGRRYETTGTFFNGKIDEVRIYPKALTPEQINQNYIQTMAFFTGPSGDPMLLAIATVLHNPAVLGLPMTMCAFVLFKTRRRKKQNPSIPFFGPLHY